MALIIAIALLVTMTASNVLAQPVPVVSLPTANAQNQQLGERMERLESLVNQIQEQNRLLMQQNQELTQRLAGSSPASPPPAPPTQSNAPRSNVTNALFPQPSPALPGRDSVDPNNLTNMAPVATTETASFQPLISGSRFLIGGYDDKKHCFALVRPVDPMRTPFELNVSLNTEIRYTGFASSSNTWTDSTGAVLPVRDMSNVNVTRNWVNLNGYAMDPKLHYSAIFLNSSTTNALLLLVSLDYEFSKAFSLGAGYSKLPVVREWYDTFRYTLGPDRTMATTFFRPNYSPGVWASGVPMEGLHYVLMLGNSFDGLNIAGNRLGTTPAFGGTVWYEGRGAYGPGISDIEDHQVITPRIGLGFAASREKLQSGSIISSNPEDTIFRLSDGTPLAQNGALGAGSHVDAVNVELLTVDAAMKYRGFSIAGEYFLRWLNNFSTSGAPINVKNLFDTGAYVQASYFLMPKTLEAYTRCSFVHGQFGNGNEWGGGFNWYIDKTRNWRFTSEIMRVNNSPAENVLTGYRAGATGTLFQTQMLIDF